MKVEKGFLDEFKKLEDPRIDRCKLYSMEEVLFLTICGVLCNCESWDDIENFGKIKLEFLREYYSYENGVPSDDTLRRFYRALDPKTFQSCFVNWMKRFQIDLKEGVIALDGKTSRRTFDEKQKPLHLVSAFASEARMVLAQEKVPEKRNEIIAIKTILEWLDLSGSLVTIDAMGCQTDIAKKIIKKDGDYLLSLKGNQGTLNDDVVTFFESELTNTFSKFSFDHHQTTEKGHGRMERRHCFVCHDIDWLKDRHPKWEALSAILCVKSERKFKHSSTNETRYFITSRDSNAESLLNATRSHWAIENSLHWVLDMSFGDDQSRIRKDNSPMNMAILKHIALNLIRNFKSSQPKLRRSLVGLRRQAGWDLALLHQLIKQNL